MKITHKPSLQLNTSLSNLGIDHKNLLTVPYLSNRHLDNQFSKQKNNQSIDSSTNSQFSYLRPTKAFLHTID